ncbi:MAG: hypothetical protein BWY63_03495 [Chloroflexi bacterium ADurb.Bin360]|nr:MAG: hypothetical protein BWY63_03495 [Chloroflexi bacterium ADurb.Bin360]
MEMGTTRVSGRSRDWRDFRIRRGSMSTGFASQSAIACHTDFGGAGVPPRNGMRCAVRFAPQRTQCCADSEFKAPQLGQFIRGIATSISQDHPGSLSWHNHPTGPGITSRINRQPPEIAPIAIHDVNLVVTVLFRDKRDLFSIRRPCSSPIIARCKGQPL